MHRHHEHTDGFARRGPRVRGGGERRGRRGDFGPWGDPRRGGGRGGRRMRRGNVRAAILALLSERAMHGYEMISELDSRTDGVWRPSPGSIYPTLQLLEDEGLVTSEEAGGKRLFTTTDTGRSEAQADPAPWTGMAAEAGESAPRARESMGQLVMALKQVMAAGDADQQARALKVVDDARRGLYAILAEEAPAGDASAEQAQG